MKALSQTIPGALLHLLQTMPLSDGKVTFAWQTAVGPALHRATSVKLEDGTLIVETTSLQWRREILRSSKVILGRLQEFLGKDAVTQIVVRSDVTGNVERRT
jgi:predicted nucleic acid-binding Zn ribbon protein